MPTSATRSSPARARISKSTSSISGLFEAEDPRLSRRALAASDVAVRLPMRRGVDSCNVTTTAAVAFGELGRDNHVIS
jgi:tRNA G18 (ribose-2'-O)-methylase SpoU